MLDTRTKNNGMKKRSMNVAESIPPATAVPIAFIAPAPAPAAFDNWLGLTNIELSEAVAPEVREEFYRVGAFRVEFIKPRPVVDVKVSFQDMLSSIILDSP